MIAFLLILATGWRHTLEAREAQVVRMLRKKSATILDAWMQVLRCVCMCVDIFIRLWRYIGTHVMEQWVLSKQIQISVI